MADDRLAGLDGIRGLAALFVVMHHCWLRSFRGFPYSDAPAWTDWLAYGHLAVVVFIVLSGFSLAVGPARSGWKLGGLRRFLQRRAWRILPPYWAALVFSLVVAWAVVPPPGEASPTAKSVVVFGLLLQDVFGSPSPNGAFWSIAIEAQLYLLMPVLLLVRRRLGAVAVLVLVLLPAVTVEVLSGAVPVLSLFHRFIPQMAVLFALGVVAAHAVGTGRDRARRLPWGLVAGLSALPPIVLIVVLGRVRTVENFFWVDLAVGPAVALLLAGLAVGRPAALSQLLDVRPLKTLGSFSYSLYLIHAPIVIMIDFLAGDHVPAGIVRLLFLLSVAVPVSLAAAWMFARMFEVPFQRHRSRQALAAAARRQYRRICRLRPEQEPAVDSAVDMIGRRSAGE